MWMNGNLFRLQIQSENFIECMQRQREALRMVERMAREIMQRKHPEQMRKPRVRHCLPWMWAFLYFVRHHVNLLGVSLVLPSSPLYRNWSSPASPVLTRGEHFTMRDSVSCSSSRRCAQVSPQVVIYGHSMAGAAISILMGYGQTDASGWLGFDGNYIMPNATPTLLIPERKEVVQ